MLQRRAAARRDELEEVLRLTKPQHFLPVHGEYAFLCAHAQLAREVPRSPGTQSAAAGERDDIGVCHFFLCHCAPLLRSLVSSCCYMFCGLYVCVSSIGGGTSSHQRCAAPIYAPIHVTMPGKAYYGATHGRPTVLL